MISGAGGYVGRALLQAMKETRHPDAITLLVRTSSADVTDLAREMNADLLDVGSLTCDAMIRRRIDAVVHLASARSSRHPEQIAASLALSARLIAAAARAGVSKFVNASSQAVYGTLPLPWREDQAAPVTPYGLAKLASEFLCQTASDAYVSLRFCKLVGPSPAFRIEPSELPHVCCLGAARHQRLVIQHPEQRLDLLDVRDAASAILAVLAADERLPPVLNIGSDRSVTSQEVASIADQCARRHFGQGLDHAFEPRRRRSARNFQMSTELVRRALGWKPRYSLHETVDDVCRLLKSGSPAVNSSTR